MAKSKISLTENIMPPSNAFHPLSASRVLFHMRIELSRRELSEVPPGEQISSQVQAEVAPGHIPPFRLLVAKPFRKVEEALHVLSDKEGENRVRFEIDALFHERLELEPVSEGDPAAVAGKKVSVVIEMVVPAPQEFGSAGLPEKGGGGIGWMGVSQPADRPPHHEEFHMSGVVFRLDDLQGILLGDFLLDPQTAKEVVVLELIDHHIPAEDLAAYLDAPLGPLERDEFGVERVHRHENPLQARGLELGET